MRDKLFCVCCGQFLSAMLCFASSAPAEPIWIHAQDAKAISPLMVPASRVGLGEADALGDFLLPTVTAMDEKPVSDSWAQFSVDVPRQGVYHLWARVRFPAGEEESFRVAAVNAAANDCEIIFKADKDPAQWHWVRCGELKLHAGPWAFRVFPQRTVATTFGPLKWRKAELTQSPRLNAICLTDKPDLQPTDAEAQVALRVKKSLPPGAKVVRAQLPPLPAEGALVENRKRVPDWMRVPRWFTKDSWRGELRHRRAGDIAALVREIAANGGETLRLSCFWGGESYYQSRVAPHAPGLGQLDYLQEAIEEAARVGAKVVVYMNPNCFYAEHPLYEECAVREPDGSVSTRPAYGFNRPNTFYACINHPRYRRFLDDVLTEIFTRYKADGLYVDGLTPQVCFCEHCRAKWHAMFGSEMPVEKLGKNPSRWAVWGEFGRESQPVGDVENDPDARRWTEMMLRTLVEATHDFSTTVKKAKPDAVTLFHSHPKAGSDDDYDGTLTEVYTPRPWVHLAWRSEELAGYSAVFSVPVLFNIYPHRHFTEAEARYHSLQGLAAGAYPNFWSALGMKPVAAYMARCADHLDFATAAPVKFLAQPRDLRETDTQRKTPKGEGVSYSPRDRFLAPYVGAYSALMRSGLPVATLHRPNFSKELDGFKVLVLANVALMSDAEAEAVRQFVREGGGLIATHETSLFDEKGRRRENFALSDVLGVRYQTVLKAEPRFVRLDKTHPLAADMAGDPLLVHDEPFVAVKATGAKAAAALLAGLQDTEARPAALTHLFGKGRVVYLPGRFDSMQCYKLCPEIERLFANAVRWVSPGSLPVEIEAPGVIGVTLFRQPQRLIAHLINHQRDSLFRSDTFAPIPNVSLRFALPNDACPRAVRRLWEDRDVPFQVKDRMVHVELGTLNEYEAIAVDLEVKSK